MKKTFFALIITMLIINTQSVNSQDRSNEIYAAWSYGVVSGQDLVEVSLDIIDGIFSFNSDEVDNNTSMTGIIRIGFNRYVNDWLKLGISGSYLGITNTRDYKKGGEVTHSVKFRDNFITAMASADFHYVRKEKITMYSGIALGASFTNSDLISGEPDVDLGTNTLFAYHLNAFGLRYGKAFGFFFEAGFGYNGLLSVGLNYAF